MLGRLKQQPLLLAFLVPLLSLLIPISTARATNQRVFSTDTPLESLPVSSFIVTSLARSIELGGATSKSSTVYTIKPATTATATGSAKRSFVFAIDERDVANLSWIEAHTGKTGNTKKHVDFHESGTLSGARLYEATITDIKSDEDTTFTVYTAYNHLTVPKPASLPQDAANQGMYWERNLLGGSQLALNGNSLPEGSVKVRVKCPTPRAAEDIVPKGWSASHTPGSSTIQFTNSEPLTSTSGDAQIASIHYEQPEPVLSIRELQRTAQVSHWGNHVAIEDDIKLVNDGPKLKGTFSRLMHQALSFNRRGAAFVTPHTLSSITYQLPPNIHSPYFIDEVGNVSTSRFQPSPKLSTTSLTARALGRSHLQLTPRYPLLGGWNYTFSMGYKQPLPDVLRHDSKKGKHVLSLPFLTDLKNAAFDDVTFRIILPEGAHDIEVIYPFQVESSAINSTYSYLDTSGRPTITLHRLSCSEFHAQDVIVAYKYNAANFLQKPAAVAGLASIVFLMLGLNNRIEWGIKAQ